MNSDCQLTEADCFPFANDNAGTIRMRSNGHGLILHDEQEMIPNGGAASMMVAAASNECPKNASSQNLPQR